MPPTGRAPRSSAQGTGLPISPSSSGACRCCSPPAPSFPTTVPQPSAASISSMSRSRRCGGFHRQGSFRDRGRFRRREDHPLAQGFLRSQADTAAVGQPWMQSLRKAPRTSPLSAGPIRAAVPTAPRSWSTSAMPSSPIRSAAGSPSSTSTIRARRSPSPSCRFIRAPGRSTARRTATCCWSSRNSISSSCRSRTTTASRSTSATPS